FRGHLLVQLLILLLQLSVLLLRLLVGLFRHAGGQCQSQHARHARDRRLVHEMSSFTSTAGREHGGCSGTSERRPRQYLSVIAPVTLHGAYQAVYWTLGHPRGEALPGAQRGQCITPRPQHVELPRKRRRHLQLTHRRSGTCPLLVPSANAKLLEMPTNPTETPGSGKPAKIGVPDDFPR